MLLRPNDRNREEMWFEFTNIDKVIHLFIFMILGFCYCMAFPKGKVYRFFIVMFLYALITEILQHAMSVGRTGEMYDFLADMLGVLMGYFIWRKIKILYN